MQRLIDRGALFDAGPDGLLRTREGGHSANRVIHAGGDATGAEIERALLAVRGLPSVLAGHQALDVVLDGSGRARGLSVLAPDGAVGLIRSGAVVLATGGAGHLYAATTNPGVATGDGLAMALRAGAALADVEFMQFHPTVLWTGPGDLGHRPLVTEAVRGEGAVLIDGAGARIMPGVHPLADLAPRDVVSLAVSRRMALAPGRHRRPCLPGRDRHRAGRLRPPVPDGVRGLRAGRRRPDHATRSRWRRQRTTTAAAC